MTKLNPYLSFNGNAEEAFNFYKSVFGGDFGALMRWGDNAEACKEMSDTDKNLIMHISLPVGDSVIMASDSPMGPLNVGNNFNVAISPETRQDADRFFSGLSEGGNVTCPMQDMFWGGYFGSFTDKFGINWLINHDNAGVGQ